MSNNTTRSDRRSRDGADLLRTLPELGYIPLIEPVYLEAVVDIIRTLPTLNYPVNSAGELLANYLRPNKVIKVAGVTFDPQQTLRFMPAYYFPIASLENFMEKLAELLAVRRRSVQVPRELAEIKAQLPPFRYPLASQREMASFFEPEKTYSFRGRMLIPHTMVRQIPRRFFPITSEGDLDRKIARLLAARPQLTAPIHGKRLPK